MGTVILTKLKLQSINDVDLTTIYSNNLRGDEIRLDPLNLWGDAYNKTTEKIFSREHLNHDGFFWKDNYKSVILRVT